MNDTFRDPTFLIAVLAGIALSFAAAAVSAGRYKVPQSGAKKLKADVLMNACNTAITVAGIATPLLAALFAYAYVQLGQSSSSLAYLAASVSLTTFSVLCGLWTVFSLAAIGNEQGIFLVHDKDNTFVPSFLMMQLGLLFFGAVSLLLYLLLGFTPAQAQIAVTTATSPALVRRPIAIGESIAAVEQAWGQPESREVRPPATILRYRTQLSGIEVGFEADQVVSISERKK